MNLLVKIQNMIKRVIVDRPGTTPQLKHLGDGVLPNVEHLEPQGLHFIAVAGADGVVVCPSAQTSATVALGLSGPVPTDAIDPGEGGLHYMGTFKVFLAKDGTTHLGQKDPDDFVAKAQLVLDELNQVKQDLTDFKSKFDGHVHPAITTATLGLSGPATVTVSATATPFPAPHSPASVGSTLVKVQ
jgi:hypothetical protein